MKDYDCVVQPLKSKVGTQIHRGNREQVHPKLAILVESTVSHTSKTHRHPLSQCSRGRHLHHHSRPLPLNSFHRRCIFY
jgi:hypothetical protein